MSRARNIKPGFFTNDQLAECEPLARILFAGLWCEADREGRLEDRPRKLKAACLPHDDCNVESLLVQLADAGLIARYEHGGAKYIAVLEFSKHQNPHVREPASIIPAPGQHRASTGQGTAEHESGPADSPSLIPDPLEEQVTCGDSSPAPAAPPPADPSAGQGEGQDQDEGPSPCPHQAIIDLYHAHLPTLPRIREWTPARQQALRARWRERPKRQSLEWWKKFFLYVDKSDFLTGRGGRSNGHAKWECSLPWLLKAENFAKVVEGHYENKGADA